MINNAAYLSIAVPARNILKMTLDLYYKKANESVHLSAIEMDLLVKMGWSGWQLLEAAVML